MIRLAWLFHKNQLPTFIYGLITNRQDLVNLRHNNTVVVPNVRTQRDINQIDFQLCKQINKLEPKWKQINKLETFKLNIKKHLISCYREIVICNSPMCIECQVIEI